MTELINKSYDYKSFVPFTWKRLYKIYTSIKTLPLSCFFSCFYPLLVVLLETHLSLITILSWPHWVLMIIHHLRYPWFSLITRVLVWPFSSLVGLWLSWLIKVMTMKVLYPFHRKRLYKIYTSIKKLPLNYFFSFLSLLGWAFRNPPIINHDSKFVYGCILIPFPG